MELAVARRDLGVIVRVERDEDERAARAKDARGLGHGAARRRDVREHVEEEHLIEGAIGQRELLRVADQGALNCSAAHACLALFEYFERRSTGDAAERSAIFLYKLSRRLLGSAGNAGVDLRSTLKAMARFGRSTPKPICSR